jgi:hypothetical protein
MAIRLKMENGDKLGRQFSFGTRRFGEKAIKAGQIVARRVAEEIEEEGRRDIRKGGNFGSARWLDGFRAKLSYTSRTDMNIRITHAVKYWKVFEYGARILGKPLLWIPLSFGDAVGIRARDYPGKLFRVDRKVGAPLLLDDNGPQYFGITSVRIPKKWHLRSIVSKISRKMNKYYKEAFRDVK